MSSDAAPISPARFAQALESLPLDALHSKAAELSNSIAHLKSSNEQMLPFADEGDDVCREAMFENLTVIGRMNERISLLRAEVERRGMRWSEGEVEDQAMVDEGKMVNGDAGQSGANGATTGTRQQNGRLTDDELRRRLETQMAEDDGDEEGVHL
jgi:hypothetical protein